MAIRRDEQYEGFDWQREAACRGEYAPHFFPPPHFEPKAMRIARERTAKAICRQCPVSSECLAYALESREPHGVWGGLNEAERRGLLDGRGAVDDRRRTLNAVTRLDTSDEPGFDEPHGIDGVDGVDPHDRGR